MNIKRVIETIRLDSHQYKQAVRILLPAILLILSIKLLPRYLQNIDNSSYPVKHEAIITNIEIKKGIQESEIGGRVVNKKFILEYQYNSEGQNYKGRTIYLREQLSIEERVRLENMKVGERIEIWLDQHHHERSKYKVNGN